MLAEQARGGRRVGVDDQLLVGRVDRLLGARAGCAVAAAPEQVSDERPLTLARRGGASRRASASVRPLPATPEHEQRALVVGDDRLLPLAQSRAPVIALVSHRVQAR